MKKILLILPVLLISLCALAAIDPQSEKQAEEFYREGKYNEAAEIYRKLRADRKSTRLNSSHWNKSRMPSSA